MARCETNPTACGHRVSGAKVGVTMTANGGVCNYCYAGGAGAHCVNRVDGWQDELEPVESIARPQPSHDSLDDAADVTQAIRICLETVVRPQPSESDRRRER